MEWYESIRSLPLSKAEDPNGSPCGMSGGRVPSWRKIETRRSTTRMRCRCHPPGLRGVELAIADAHEGIKAAVTKVLT